MVSLPQHRATHHCLHFLQAADLPLVGKAAWFYYENIHRFILHSKLCSKFFVEFYSKCGIIFAERHKREVQGKENPLCPAACPPQVCYNKGKTIQMKGALRMPNIKPISDLRNYTEVLQDVSVGAPVFLTKNGRGKYAIMDIHDYERTQATIRLLNELAKGRKSGEEKGWFTLEEVERELGVLDE